jgi:hypothetical protein
MGEATLVAAETIVLRSCWPYRASAPGDEHGESGDSDPLVLASADGSLMLGHLRRSAGVSGVDAGGGNAPPTAPPTAPPRPHGAGAGNPGLARDT